MKHNILRTLLFSAMMLPGLALAQTTPTADTARKDTASKKPAAADTVTEVPLEEPGTTALPKGEHELGTEEITAAERLKIEDLKPHFFPMIDPYEPINAVLKPERYVFDDKLYATIDSISVPSQYLHSSYIRTPVVDRLIQGDVLVFLPRFEKSVANWELVISNSLGETVRRIKQKGSPPNIINWDGRDDKGEVVNAGETYDFTFYAYDAIGNQTRIPGRPQRIAGIVYQDGPEWIIVIAGDEIFEPLGSRLTQNSARWLDEAGNVIKEKFKTEAVVYVYTDREGLSNERANVVVSELARRVLFPKDALKSASRFIPGLQPKYSKIEIHVR